MSPELQDYLAAERLLEAHRDRLSPEDQAYIDAREVIDDCVWSMLEKYQRGGEGMDEAQRPQTLYATGTPLGRNPRYGLGED